MAADYLTQAQCETTLTTLYTEYNALINRPKDVMDAAALRITEQSIRDIRNEIEWWETKRKAIIGDVSTSEFGAIKAIWRPSA